MKNHCSPSDASSPEAPEIFVLQIRERSKLVLQAVERLGVEPVESLQGQLGAGVRVEGAVDEAGATPTQRAKQLVAPERNR